MNKDKVKAVIFDAKQNKWLQFKDPVKTVSTDSVDEVFRCLNEVENSVEDANLYAVGFITYEASPAFDSALKVKQYNHFAPLLWFSLFEHCNEIEIPDTNNTQQYFTDWEMSVSREEYDKGIAAVKHNIYEGNTYQVNYTTRQYAEFKGQPFELFCELAKAQNAKYSAYIESEDLCICSASPELFFCYENNKIISKPMKGTAKRKFIFEKDESQAEWLHNSIKNRAENVMIVDMIRNDMGRIADPGTVKVSERFQVEKYPTVWQMTSTVKAETSKSISEIFKALFPCASITGAPKAYTMKIISDIEATPRGIYTGAVGFIMPGKRCQFNVAIRTVTIDKKNSKAEFGVGGGIVWDSIDKDEYEECLTKTRFLNHRQKDFQILESILWTKEEGFFLIDYHFRRMKRAASYFDYPISIDEIGKVLRNKEKEFIENMYKIRILLFQNGKVNIEIQPLPENYKKANPFVVIADEPIETNTPFVYYKTTNRKYYDKFRDRYSDYYDVILWNKNGEVTETTVANLVVEIGGEYYTPPVKSGLLAGTFRESLLLMGKIKERIISVEELSMADNVYLINSIRKWVKLEVLNI